MKFIDLKVFLGASGAGMGFDKSEREIVISLSQFVDWGGTSRLGMAKGVTCFVLPGHCFPRWWDQLPLNKRWTGNSMRITTALFQFGMHNGKLVFLPLPGGTGTFWGQNMIVSGQTCFKICPKSSGIYLSYVVVDPRCHIAEYNYTLILHMFPCQQRRAVGNLPITFLTFSLTFWKDLWAF